MAISFDTGEEKCLLFKDNFLFKVSEVMTEYGGEISRLVENRNIEALVLLLTNSDPAVRKSAASALGVLEAKEAVMRIGRPLKQTLLLLPRSADSL